MNLREINNIGQPLRGPDGQPLGGVKIKFSLCSPNGTPSKALDVTDKELYIPMEVVAITSAVDTATLKKGEFRVSLWPTSRGDRSLAYRVALNTPTAVQDAICPLVEGTEPVPFSSFLLSGATLTPAETSALDAHIQDTSIHISAASILTYAELKVRADASQLVPEQLYTIADYQAFQTVNKPDGTDEILAFPVTFEPLTVRAKSTSSIYPEAHSVLFPGDIIRYDLSNIGPRDGYNHQKGRITYRSGLTITAHEDWRNRIGRRWNTSPDGTGTYTLIWPLGGFPTAYPYQDRPMIGIECHDITIGEPDASLSGMVIGDYSEDIIIEADNNEITIGEYASVIYIGMSGDPYIIGAQSNYIRIGACATGTKIGFGCANISIGDSGAVDVGDNCFNVVMDNNVAATFKLLPGTRDVHLSHSQYGQIGYGSLEDPIVISSSNGTFGPTSTLQANLDPDSTYDLKSAYWSEDGIAWNGPTDIRYAGVVTLRGQGGTFFMGQLLNFPDHPITFKAQPGFTFTLSCVPFADIAASSQIMGTTNIVLNGNAGDEVTLKKVRITNTNGTFDVLKEVYRTIQ